MVYQEQQLQNFPSDAPNEAFDFTYIPNAARVAVYDDMKMAPKIIEVAPNTTQDYIEELATKINDECLKLGGSIPYTAIREVSENFIHAKFSEVVVSILDKGNTIRFCDQGPGIPQKEKALRPGFTSAIEPMKRYIRGVGSGLPIVKEYLDVSHGRITIEDNVGTGAVVTISLIQQPQSSLSLSIPPLKDREKQTLLYLADNGAIGNKELADYLGIAGSSANVILKKLEELGYIERTYNKKRILTDLGSAVSQQI